jgi:AAHS family 4-hydroxybenzoate transporter-like MFS transporter
MTDQSVIQVSRLLDERGLSSFQIKLLIWSFFIVLIDGYDIAAIAFAAPSLAKEWALKPGSLGPVFSAA